MTAGLDDDWSAFVTSAWPGLVRDAALFAGDAEAAEALAEAALVRAHRGSWAARRLDPEQRARHWAERARRGLLAPRARPAAWLPLGARSWGRRSRLDSCDSGGLLGRYRALEPRARGLLVLTIADGLDVAAAAGVLGIPPATAADAVLAALDSLKGDRSGRSEVVELDLGQVTGDPGDRPAAATELMARDPVVGELREMFAALEPLVPAAQEAPRRVELAERADRRLRRRTTALTACLVVAVAAAVSVVAGENSRAAAQRQREAEARAAHAGLHPGVLTSDVSAWPTRGSLATDVALLGEVRAHFRAQSAVLFLGDVGGLDVAVGASGAGGDQPLDLHVLSGPAGTPVGTWQESGGALVYPVEVPVVSVAIQDDQGRLHLLALTVTSGVQLAYSPAPILADDGTVTRRYIELGLDEGVGAAVTASTPERLRLRVDSPGTQTVTSPDVEAPASGGEVPPLTATVSSARSCDPADVDSDVTNIVDEATRESGLSVADVTSVRLLWCRRRGDQVEVGSALAARHGPDIQCALTGTRTPEEGQFGLQCWPVARGAGTTAPFLVPDPGLAAGTPTSAFTVSVSAPGAATAELRAGPDGAVTVARATVAADGYARIAVPASAVRPEWILDSQGVVALLDAHGRTTARLMVSARDPGDVWGDRLDGPVGEASWSEGSPVSVGSGGRGWEGLVQ